MPCGSASLAGEETGGRSQQQVEQPEEDARDNDEYEHHERGRERFRAVGPEDLAQLDARLEEELPEVAAVRREREYQHAQPDAAEQRHPAEPRLGTALE